MVDAFASVRRASVRARVVVDIPNRYPRKSARNRSTNLLSIPAEFRD